MNTTRPMTRPPRAVAAEALRLAQEALPAYSSKSSRKDYTLHQLFAILARPTAAVDAALESRHTSRYSFKRRPQA